MTNVSDLYRSYAGAIARVRVRTRSGDESVGAAFHVGSGVFVTARHVVEDNQILEVATVVRHVVDDPDGNVHLGDRRGRFIEARAGQITSGPHMHPDDTVDVAVFLVNDLRAAPHVELGGHLNDWINGDEFVLWEGAVFGFPIVPQSRDSNLFAARAEVNTFVDKYVGCTSHPHFVISAMARGGYSGGPFIIAQPDKERGHAGWCLGVVTESLLMNGMVAETGFLTVLTVEPIFVCLEHHRLFPREQKADWWQGAWDGCEEPSLGDNERSGPPRQTTPDDSEDDPSF